MKELLARFVREEDGQDLIEYSLLLALISLGAISSMALLGTAVNSKYELATATMNTGS